MKNLSSLGLQKINGGCTRGNSGCIAGGDGGGDGGSPSLLDRFLALFQ